MKLKYNMGDATAIKVVLSPFTGNNFDALNLASIIIGSENPRLRL